MDGVLKKVDEQLGKLRQALEQQKAELRESMDNTLKAVNQRQKSEPKAPTLPVVDNLILPPDLRKWRTAHVLAWLVFDRGLKQYVLPFHEASIDGIVLVTHVTEGWSQPLLSDTPSHIILVIHIALENLILPFIHILDAPSPPLSPTSSCSSSHHFRQPDGPFHPHSSTL